MAPKHDEPLGFSALMEHSDDYILISDHQGMPVRFNTAYAQVMKSIMGIEMKPGLQPHKLQDDPEKVAYWDHLHRRVLSGEKFRVDIAHELADGNKVYLEVSFSPIVEQGQVKGFIEITRDLSRRMQMQESLRQNEELYRSVYDTAPLAFVIWDMDHRVVDWNNTAEQTFGWSKKEALGRNFFELIVPESAQEDVNRAVNTLLADEHMGPLVNANVTKDGRIIMCQWTNSVLHDVTGKPTGAISLALDVTEQLRVQKEREELERRVQHAQKMESLGLLAGGIAHDFNNILMGVLGNADLALMSLPKETPAYDNLQDIVSASVRAAELARQMLAYSGKGKFLVEPVDLNSMFLEMTHLLKTVISKKCSLRFDLAENIPQIKADVTQIRQLFMNLVTNASEAMGDDGGVVAVSSGLVQMDQNLLSETYMGDELDEGEYAFLKVEDKGCGMAQDTLDKMFDPFFSTKFTGRGLGLSAALGIIRGHGGTIKVETELGRGTAITVLFPNAQLEYLTGAEQDQAQQETYAWAGQGTVLVVDDEQPVLQVTRSILERCGLTVHTASDGQDGLDCFRAQPDVFSAVVLDMTMPRLSGLEVLAEIKRIRPQVKVLMSSGFSEPDLGPVDPGAGADGFIQKPYRASEIIAQLRLLLED